MIKKGTKISNGVKKTKKPDIRYLNEIRDLLYDQNWAKNAPNIKLYYMHRGVKKKGGLRYDVTIIPPRMLGKEFVKTKGNHNSNNFPELYIVLKGRALILMQKTIGKSVKKAIAIKLKRGESIIEPADYDVITINPSRQILEITNWVSEKNKNIYKNIEKMKGACYFFTKDGWVKNKNYKKIPKLIFKKPLKKIPKNLDFLYGEED